MVALAIIFTLALLTFTGCSNNRTYNLDNCDLLFVSEKIEEVMSSCVVVKTTAPLTLTTGQKGKNTYYGLGVAVTEKKILVPAQSVPKSLYGSTFLGRIIDGDQTFKLVCDISDNVIEDGKRPTFNILTLPDSSNIKLKPVKFADSDSIVLGQSLFGINISIPEDELSVASSADYFAPYLTTEEYLGMTKFWVSSNGFSIGSHDGLLKAPQEIKDSTFTVQGNINASDTHTYTYYEDKDILGKPIKVGYEHGMKGYITTRCFNFANSMIFNVDGEFIGVNYARLVNNLEINTQVVFGYGYATKSNYIKSILKSKNIEVA